LPDLIADVRACNPHITRFDASCFDGEYVTGGVSAAYLASIEANRIEGETADQGGQTTLHANQLDLGFSTVD
jgi:amidophosphoribosyltransferase